MVDLSGRRFGHWSVMKTYRTQKGGHARTLNDCRCNCGATAVIRSENLLAGRSNGCSRCARRLAPNTYTFIDGAVRATCANGVLFLIDAEDFPVVEKHQWFQYGRYIGTSIAGRQVLLHRLLMGVVGLDGVCIDHISGDSRDNRRCNLRVCRQRDNAKNQDLSVSNSTGYKGVAWHSKAKKYVAQIRSNGNYHYLGLYTTSEEAAAVYDRAALLYHGEFARTNKMLGLL
jgi:hypothetical protein